MIGWLIALGLLIVLLALPVGVVLQYDTEGGRAVLVVGPCRFSLYPKTDKQSKKKRTKKEAPKQKTGSTTSGGPITDFLKLLQVVLDLLKDFRKKLCISYLQLKLTLADHDPSDLAIKYGKAWAVVGSLLPLLESAFTIRKRDVDVGCDFCAEVTRITAKAYLKVSVADVLWLAGKYGIQAITKYYKIMNNRKGGAEI